MLVSNGRGLKSHKGQGRDATSFDEVVETVDLEHSHEVQALVYVKVKGRVAHHCVTMFGGLLRKLDSSKIAFLREFAQSR